MHAYYFNFFLAARLIEYARKIGALETKKVVILKLHNRTNSNALHIYDQLDAHIKYTCRRIYVRI